MRKKIMTKNETINSTENRNFFKFSIIFVILYSFIIFGVRLMMLLKSDFPTGLDGFFYALQAKSLVVNGALENPDHEIGYFLCGFWAKIFNNVFLGVKIQAALSSTLISVLIFILLKIISQEKNIIPILGLLISSVSVGITLFNINYINNQTGLVFFLSYCTALIYLLQNAGRFSKIKKNLLLFLCTILLVLSGLSHLVSAAYAFIFTAIILIRKLKIRNQIILLTLACLCAVLLFFNQLPRFQSVFSLTPVLPCFSPVLMNLAGKAMCIEMSVYFVLTWFLGLFFFINKHKDQNCKKDFAFLLLIPVMFFPFWKLDELDMGYRMLLNAIPVSIPFNLYIISKIFDFSKIKESKYVTLVLFITIFTTGLFFTPKLYNPKKDPPWKYYKSVVEKIDLPDDSLLIAHLPINHVYTYYCNLRDGLNYEADFFVSEGKTWRLAYGTNASYLQQFFGEFEEEELNQLIMQLNGEYVLIREDLWQRYLKYEEDDIVDSLMNFYNPHTLRPEFIRKHEN